MWAYLDTWLVQDGEVPELEPGGVLPHVALRAACWSLDESQGRERIEESYGLDPSGEPTAHHEVAGAAVWRPGTGYEGRS